MSDPQNKDRWEAHPASSRQIARLQWASARLRRPLPASLSKAKAHELIDAWFEEFPDLESEWYEEKDRRVELGWEVEIVASEVDDWREFYRCQRVPKSVVQAVLKSIGSRKEGERLDQFMARFFAALRSENPALFSGKSEDAKKPSSPPRGMGCLVVLSAGLLILILCILCAMR